MIFTKIITVITFAIIIAFLVGPTNANYTICINEIISIGHITEESTISDVFKYIFLHCDHVMANNLSTNGILKKYIKYVFKKAMKKYNKNILKSPLEWCIKLQEGSNFGQIKSLEEAKAAAIANEEKCRSSLSKSSFQANDDVPTALDTAYYFLRKNTKYMKLISKQYFGYMEDHLMEAFDLSSVMSPQEYCQYHWGAGGNSNEASSSGTQQTDNPNLDLTLSL